MFLVLEMLKPFDFQHLIVVVSLELPKRAFRFLSAECLKRSLVSCLTVEIVSRPLQAGVDMGASEFGSLTLCSVAVEALNGQHQLCTIVPETFWQGELTYCGGWCVMSCTKIKMKELFLDLLLSANVYTRRLSL